jgi:hypothetical protein
MVLPLDMGGVTYDWGNGYNGGDVADELYRVPAVSQSLTYSLFGTTYLTSNLNAAAVSEPMNFWKLAAITNSRYIVVSNDLNATDRQLVSPSVIQNYLGGAYSPSISSGMVDPSGSHVSSIPLTKDDISMAWADLTAFNYILSVSSISDPQGNVAVNATAIPNNGGLGVWIEIPKNMTNTSTDRYLEVWLRSSQSGQVYVEARDPMAHSATWDGRLNPNYSLVKDSWKLLVLPLDVPSQLANTPGPLERGNITRLLIGATNLNHALTDFEIGGVFLDQGNFSGPARNISLVGQYGKLTLYQLNSTVFLPRIYSTTKAVIENSTGEFLSSLELFNPADAVIIQSSEIQRNGITLPFASFRRPNLTFQMVSPSLYDVQVTASGPYMLVLSETYNPLWVASGPWGTVPNTNHFVVNGYANMWYIAQPGSYSLRLSFLPNQYVVDGTLAALLALIFGFIAVYARRVKRVGLRFLFVIVALVRNMNTRRILPRTAYYHSGNSRDRSTKSL